MKTQKIVLGVFISISLVLAFLLFRQQSGSLQENKDQPAIIGEAQTEAKKLAQTVDKQGYSKAVFQRQKEVVGNGDISKLPISRKVYDSLRLDNLAKDAKLQQASLINANLVAKNLRSTKKLDSLQNVYYVYNDDFATAMFTPDSAGGKFDINYRISLVRQDYKKRRNFLSPYVNYTEILSPDPRITINGLQSLTFKEERRTKWGIGLQAGYYYDHSQQKLLPALGFGVSYNLIRF